MPLFSVIIPVFNAECTLRETLQSVFNQTFANWELIITNDGSTDDSLGIIQEETKERTNVVLIDQENKGLGAARNTAAKKANGEWLVFLDADDYWASNKLTELQTVMAANSKAEVIYHPILEKRPNGLMRKRRFWQVNSTDEFLQFGNPLVPSAVAIKRQVFLKNGGFIEDRNQVEDLMLWFRLFHAKTKFVHCIKPLTVYRVGSGVTSRLEDHLTKVFNAMQNAVNEGLVDSGAVPRFKQQKYYEAARQLHKLGQFATAQDYYQKAERTGFKSSVLQLLCRFQVSI